MLRFFRKVPFAMAVIAAAVAKAYDPYYPSVTSELHGGTLSNVRDEQGNTVTNNNVIIGNNAGSGNFCYFNGSSQFNIPASNDFNFGGGDFTIEGKFYPTTLTGIQRLIMSYNSAINGAIFGVYLNGGTLSAFMSSSDLADSNPSKVNVGCNNTNIKLGQWNHFAFVRIGNTWQLYVNGIATSAAVVSSLVQGANNYPVYIGARNYQGSIIEYFTGSMDSIRITKGVGRYSNSFTPSNYPLDATDTDWSSVTLAIDFTDGIVDKKGHTVTNAGTLLMPSTSVGSDVLYFNGTNAYLTNNIGTGAAFASTDDFTVELQVNFLATPSASGMTLMTNSYNSGGLAITATNTSLNINRSYIGVDVSIPLTWTTNKWYQIVVMRKSGYLYVFRDGTLIAKQANTLTYNSANVILGISADFTNNPFRGYISQFRITKGIARYSFSGVANAFIVDTDTLSLMHFDSDVGLVDSALVPPTWTLVGTAALSNAQKKFGTSALNVPSASSAVRTSGFTWNIGTGDYTLEFMFFNNAASDSYVFDTGFAGGATRMFLSNNAGGTTLRFVENYGGTGGVDISFTKPALNEWHHIAIVRSNGTTRIFLDYLEVGNGVSTVSITLNCMSLGAYTSAGPGASSYGFLGYYDEFRVSKIARYPANGFNNIPTQTEIFPDHRAADYYWDSNVVLMDMESLQNSVTGEYAGVLGSCALTNANTRFGTQSLAPTAATTGQAIMLAPSTNWDFSAIDCTLEAQVYLPSGFTATSLFGQCFTGGDGNWVCYINADGSISIGKSGVNAINSAAGVFKPAQWNHVAYVKTGSTVLIFVNGIQVASATTVVFNSNPTGFLGIGFGLTGMAPKLGSAMANVRFTRGIARYTAAFTPPNAAFYKLTSQNGDPQYAKVVTLCHFDGTDGSTTIVDSTGQVAFTASGTAAIKTNGSALGGAAASFDGVANSAFRTAAPATNSALDLATGTPDFTIEMKINPTNYPTGETGSQGYIFSWGGGYAAGYEPIAIQLGGTGKIGFGWNSANSATNQNWISSTTSVPLNQWSTIAVVKAGNRYYLFVNGILEATKVSSVNPYYWANGWSLGQALNNTYKYSGWVDELRITKGFARYQSNYPVAGIPFVLNAETISFDVYSKYVSLQMEMEDITDAVGHTLTNVGNVAFQSTVTKFGTAAAQFNGSNYLSGTQTGTEFDFGTGDFAIETFTNVPTLPTIGNFATIISGGNEAAGNGNTWAFGIGNVGGVLCLGVKFWNGTSYNYLTGNYTFLTNKWYHVSITRKNGLLNMLVDGVLVYSNSPGSLAMNSGSNGIKIGARCTTNASTVADYFTGYMAGLRVCKGTRRYPNFYMPPANKYPVYKAAA